MEANWIQEYKKTEENAEHLLPLEEREIFVKYSSGDDKFLPEYEPQALSINYNNPDRDKIEIIKFSDVTEIPSLMKNLKDKDKVQAFINSKMSTGIIIKVKAESEIKDPIKINSILSNSCSSKILVYVGKNSKVSLIVEEFSEKNAYYGQNIDIITEEDSCISLLSIQNSAGVTAKNYRIFSSGKVNLIELITSAGSTRERIWIDLLEHSEIIVKQAVIGSNNAYFDIEAEINHTAKNTKSNITYKDALAGSAKSIYKGVILQGENACNSYAYLSESSLVLSKDAKNISVPSLEIAHNELKAYHSASSEPINKNAIFYLMSKGLDSKSAKMLITNGFLSQIFDESTLGYTIINSKISEKLNSIKF